MEDLSAISVTKQNPFCVEMMKRLNIQRKQGHLCDITLITKDDQELKAHRNILSAASPFFCKLLQSDMKENREGIVRLEEISGSVMEDVLEFIYTGTVEVTEENAEELVVATNYLLVTNLKTIASRFIQQRMCELNCISTFYLAEKYDCEELLNDSRSFASVADMKEFLSLEAKEVERWISSDDIVVETEAEVFQIAQKWVEHNKSERKAAFEELLRHVRLVFVLRDYLLNVATNELVRDNAGCFTLVSDAIRQTTFSSDDDLLQSPRKGLDTRAIVACEGEYAFCYVPQKDEWKRLPTCSCSAKKPSIGIPSTHIIRFRDQLIKFCSLGLAERYDPFLNGWSSFPFCFGIGWNKVTVIKGELFSIHETVARIKKDRINTKTVTIKKFQVETCSWQKLHSSSQCYRKDSCVIGSDNFLYLLGGTLPHTSQHVAKVDRFDITEKKWEEITDMQQARGGAFGVASQEKIFVAGGADEESTVLKTCEVYNISTNEWQLIANLNVYRTHGSMVCLGGTLYVLGGFDQSKKNPERSVECYDKQGKWIVKTTIPVEEGYEEKQAFKGCVLKFSKGVLDYLDDAVEDEDEDD